MKVVDDTVGAIDLSQVVLIEHEKNIKYDGVLTQEDLQYQENRRRRKVRRLDFEERWCLIWMNVIFPTFTLINAFKLMVSVNEWRRMDLDAMELVSLDTMFKQ